MHAEKRRKKMINHAWALHLLKQEAIVSDKGFVRI